jgi:hypothetical protein
MRAVFFAETRAGQLVVYRREDMRRHLASMGDVPIKVTIEKRYSRRSSRQNSYYWGVVVSVIHERLVEFGWDVTQEETHEFLKDRFNRREYISPDTGEVFSVIKETKGMDTVEFNRYIDDIIRFSAETLDVQVPYPNEQLDIF